MNDLKKLLNQGTILEQKSFIQSFVKRIFVNHPEVKIEYNLLIIKEIGRSSKTEVLPIEQTGSSYWTASEFFGEIATENVRLNQLILQY